MLNLLEATCEDSKKRRLALHHTLTKFGLNVFVESEECGPTTRTYVIEPGETSIRKIRARLEDLAVGLGVESVHLMQEAGKLRIQVPRIDREFPDSLEASRAHPCSDFRILMGITTNGKAKCVSLEHLPHLLISGSTGSGKSVALHHVICSLISKHCPSKLRLVLIDPKAIELTRYDDVPHLATSAVITSPSEALLCLRELSRMMEKRYLELQSKGLVSAYADPSMPKFVVVIDEYADLRAQLDKHIEYEVLKLAQKARAAGIHLILATQRPSAKVITGDIKANFPSRLALRAASAIDSRVVLGVRGAEGLLGNGDAILSDNGHHVRVQVPYAGPEHVDLLKQHYANQS